MEFVTREIDREMKQAEMHLKPFLEAEKDRMIIRAIHESRRYEDYVLKDNEDWQKAGDHRTYYTKKFVPEYMIGQPESELFRYPAFKNVTRLFH
jgi:hypothetical protein